MIREKLAIQLKKYRQNSKLTINEVGEKIGKSGKTVSAWENCRGQPDADMLLQLCEIYGITDINELYGNSLETKTVTLTQEEQLLLDNYRKLDYVDKGKINERIETMLENEKYQKTDLSSLIS